MIVALSRKKLSFLLFMIASFMQSAFYWLLAVVITRTYGVESLGTYSYALAIVTPVSVLGSLQLKSFFLTKRDHHLAGQIKWLRFSFLTTLLIASGIIVTFLEPWLLPLFILICVLKWGEAWSELSHTLWQAETGLEKVTSSLFIRYGFLIIILMLLLSLDFSLVEGLLALAVGSLLIALRDNIISPLKNVKFTRAGSAQTFFTTFSLSLSALLTALLVNVPRYQLKELKTLEEVGGFTLLFYYYVLPSMVINSTCQGLLKEFQDFGKVPRVMSKVIGSTFLLSVLLFSFLLLFGKELTFAVYQTIPEWNFLLVALICLALFFGSTASILHFLLLGAGIYDIQFKANLVSCAVTTGMGFLLIPSMGITGAFISFVTGLLIQSIVYIFKFRRLNHA
jgi:O-antigen/teichoic acid export membrane protein